MDKELLFDEILKEKAGNEQMVLPEDVNNIIKETIDNLPEKRKAKVEVINMFNNMCNIVFTEKLAGALTVTVFILILIGIPIVANYYTKTADTKHQGNNAVVENQNNNITINKGLKALNSPDKIFVYYKENKIEIDKNDSNFAKIVELTKERVNVKLDEAKDEVDDKTIVDMHKDGIGIEFIYDNEQEIFTEGQGKDKRLKFYKLYFQLESEKNANSQGSIVNCMQYGDKEHYIDSSRGPLKYSEALVKIAQDIVSENARQWPNYKDEFSIFIKKTNKPPMSTGRSDNVENNELWIRYSSGKEELLVACRADDNIEKIIAGIHSPQITPDRTKIYFLSGAYMVSDIVYVYDLKTKSVRYVCVGNYLEIIQKGQYEGKLIVNQHRYRSAPDYGSYDHYYILDEDGNEIKDLGEKIQNLD